MKKVFSVCSESRTHGSEGLKEVALFRLRYNNATACFCSKVLEVYRLRVGPLQFHRRLRGV